MSSPRLRACIAGLQALLLGLMLTSCVREQPAATDSSAPKPASTPRPTLPEGFSTIPTVKQPTWAGEYHWSMRDAEQSSPPFHLRMGFTALPSGDWSISGSLQLDDAELGASGSARLRHGQLIIDLLVSGSVRDAPLDAGKRALFPPGQAPARVDSAGFATMRIELEPNTLQGSAQRYQVNVVQGGHVQGPVHVASTLTPVQSDATP